MLISDDADLTLIVDRSIAGFQISRMQGDDLQPGGRRYTSADEVVTVLKQMTAIGNEGSHRRAA